ncbi:hypothetical protein CgunFtcFv8_019309 [Champsocephalus gunnari]|uniref:Pyrin domain-containing protein n=1 Tax=Champsocephalus gunnari TaxID=52237 RepID=A0AAN8DEV6_CHAGU|nr:hypothetical protein CgunFtcFv8_019309 [Champsocephalus gunnari]
MAIADMFEGLSSSNFDNFRHELLHRKEGPRVARIRVEGKSRLEITNVLVSTFTETGAVGVAVEMLREIHCNEEADQLVRNTTGKH